MDPHRAYAVLKHWYRHTSAHAPNPYRTDMEKVRGEFQTLYQREDPPTSVRITSDSGYGRHNLGRIGSLGVLEDQDIPPQLLCDLPF